jgi:hypothetical protein
MFSVYLSMGWTYRLGPVGRVRILERVLDPVSGLKNTSFSPHSWIALYTITLQYM